MASFLGVLRVLFLSLVVSVAVAADDDKSSCQNPKVRREWRQLSADEQAEWIRAMNVRSQYPRRDLKC